MSKKIRPACPSPRSRCSRNPSRRSAAGQIAVFVSRKDGKLYVRQNFAPLFDVPVTIAPSDRPLGTHVFTARGRQGRRQPAALVGGLAARAVAVRRAARRGRARLAPAQDDAAPVETKPVPVPNSAAEALDRLTFPPDAMARITEALSTGGSIVVSDQGIAGAAKPAKARISSFRCARVGRPVALDRALS